MPTLHALAPTCRQQRYIDDRVIPQVNVDCNRVGCTAGDNTAWTSHTHPHGRSCSNILLFKIPDMNELPFRARQKRPTVVMGVEPDREQALGFVLVSVDDGALISTEMKSDNMCIVC